MRKRVKQTIGRKQIIMANWRALADWIDILMPSIRIVAVGILMNVLVFHVNSVVIPVFSFRISAMAMRYIILGTHIVWIIWMANDEDDRGWLYELSRMMLASELVLFPYFVQRRFAAACIILAVYIFGGIALCIYGNLRFEQLYEAGRLPRSLLNGVIVPRRRRLRAGDIMRAALHRYVVIGGALILAVPAAAAVFAYGMDGAMEKGSLHAVVQEGEENRMLENLGAIRMLEDGRWDGLSVQEKIDILQIVADIETGHLNIVPVTVVNYHLEGTVFGSYDHEQRQVQIDMDKHEGYMSLEYVGTILHECRHAFQHDCVDSLDWNDPEILNGIYYAEARQWRYENEHYILSSQDRDAYYNQEIEKDARRYSEEGLPIYDQYILLSNLPAR